jgi:hypothetical protein
MPLIDIGLAVSGLDSNTLEQVGIIANFFAGFLLASEYFLLNDKINRLNDYLEYHISAAYVDFSEKIKLYAKWNRRVVLITFLIVILLSVYQIIFHSADLWDYIIYYYGLAKRILIPMRRVLLASLSTLAIMFILLLIARYTPKKMISAFAILFFMVGNILLLLSTLFE